MVIAPSAFDDYWLTAMTPTPRNGHSTPASNAPSTSTQRRYIHTLSFNKKNPTLLLFFSPPLPPLLLSLFFCIYRLYYHLFSLNLFSSINYSDSFAGLYRVSRRVNVSSLSFSSRLLLRCKQPSM